MSGTDLSLMTLLKERMAYLSKRQDVLSQNVASADIAGYTPKDLKEPDFESVLRSTASTRAGALSVTNSRHIAMTSQSANGGFEMVAKGDVAASPNGNSVSLEQQMIKVADTQAQYAAVTNLYAKAITMMKTAIGRGGG